MAIKLEAKKITPGKYNAEDKKPHDTVAAIFSKGSGDKCKYLIEDHIKHDMLTFPIGKVKPDQSITEALEAECHEETNLKVKEYQEVLNYSRFYDFTGKKVPVHTHVFKVISYTGELKNAEPKKHRWIRWMTRKDIEGAKRKIADAVVAYFKWLDDVNEASILKPHVKVGG